MTDWSTHPAGQRKPEKVSGAWVFAGTRLPPSALYENLAPGLALWLEGRPSAGGRQLTEIWPSP